MKRSRLTIVGLMFAVVFLALQPYRADARTLLYLLGIVLLSPFILVPIRIHRTQWVAADPKLVPIDPEGPAAPPEASTHYREAVAGLASLGFVAKQTYSTPNLVPNVISFVTLFQNDKTSEVAKFITSFAAGANFQEKAGFLVFKTEFADGTEIITSNSHVPRIHPPLGPPIHCFAFPQIQRAGCLYAAHRAVVGQSEGGGPRRDPLGHDPDVYLQQAERRRLAHLIACGYYYMDEVSDVQRPTWKGATLMAWKSLWPVEPIRQGLRRVRAEKMIRELGVS